MIFSEVTSNGIRVVGEIMPSYQSVSLGIWVAAGPIYEQDGERGISHFIEHMLFKGTKNRTAEQIAIEMDMLGGNLNAFTAKECTCFYVKVLDKHLAVAADILSDMLHNPRLDKEDIEREAGVICEEILMNEDSPEDVAHEKLNSIYYEGSPLALPILGTYDSVRAMTDDDMKKYMSRMYTPNN
ncbi:MAG: insulinase family protein, partial [Clostridiales bacterium]|nr:insulinase family protein [Clostridiales bacterium]